MKKRLFLVPFVSLFALTSCDLLDKIKNFFAPTEEKQNEKEKEKPTEEDIHVTSVNIIESSIEISEEGSETLEYEVLPENATNKNVIWSTSDGTIATVYNGTVYGVSEGQATITITTKDGGFTDTCLVNVDPKPIIGPTVHVTSVNIIKDSASIEEGKTETLQYSVWPTNATDKSVTWDSSNKTVATVNNGVVSAHKAGNTTITIKTNDGNKTDTCAVTVTEAQQTPPEPDNGVFYGGLVEGTNYTGYEFSKSEDEIVKPTSGQDTINIYAFNDFHGSIKSQQGADGNETGLKQIGTYFKEKSQEDNSLIFDQGDTWQGSFESNYQHGALIQDVMTYAGVSARTLGNHDFDWGLGHLEATSSRTLDGNYIPSLGANVYDYSNGINGDVQQKQLGKEYATYILDNGIKVGVIGVIGDNQITSICSQLVSTICFTNYVDKIKELSDFLRTEKECDVIIASTHEGSSSARHVGLTELSPTSGKRYVDLVLGGHQHYNQEYTVDGVKFVQWSSNGMNTGKVTLTYDFSTDSIVDESTSVNTYNSSWFDAYYPVCDPVIEDMVDSYLEDIEPIGNEVLSTNFDGYFDDGKMARVMTEAIFDRVSKTHPEVQFACSNYARTSFSGNTFTYADLYRCFPFDNQIIQMDVSTQQGLNSLSNNYSYREDTSLYPNYGSSYKCAIIDYVAVHQNSNREYDRFPDAGNGYEVFNDTDGYPPTYREILYAYLKANPNKIYNSSNYSYSNPHFIG